MDRLKGHDVSSLQENEILMPCTKNKVYRLDKLFLEFVVFIWIIVLSTLLVLRKGDNIFFCVSQTFPYYFYSTIPENKEKYHIKEGSKTKEQVYITEYAKGVYVHIIYKGCYKGQEAYIKGAYKDKKC